MFSKKTNSESEFLFASLKFKNFKSAWHFMNLVATEVEKLNHHPNWSNVYNKVDISLNTHDKGDKITELDYNLAKKIEEIYESIKH